MRVLRRCLPMVATVLAGCGSATAGDGQATATSPAVTSATVASTVPASLDVVTASSTEPGTMIVPAASEPTPASTAPLALTCTTSYRTAVTVPPTDGPVLTFTSPGEQDANFADLHLTARYSNDGYDSPSLSIHVETLPGNTLLFSSLYQFTDPTGRLDKFIATGQGFTGLNYVYNPTSGAELQFFCNSG